MDDHSTIQYWGAQWQYDTGCDCPRCVDHRNRECPVSEHPGTCATCRRWGYLFASGLCLLCEDARLVAAYRESRNEADGEALAMFRDYIHE